MGAAMSYEEILQKVGHLLTRNLGYSMLPLLRQNQDAIMIERCDPHHLQKYDVVMFTRPGDRKGKYVLHRILKCKKDGSYWVVGDNCTSGEIVKPEQIVGRMSAVGRNGKTFKTTSEEYQRYVRFWCKPWPLRMAFLWLFYTLQWLREKTGRKIEKIKV